MNCCHNHASYLYGTPRENCKLKRNSNLKLAVRKNSNPTAVPPAPTRENLQIGSPPPRPLKQYEAFSLRPRQKKLAALGLVSTDVLHFFVLVVGLVLSTIGGIPCAPLRSSTAESRRVPPPECRLFFLSPGGLHGSVQPRLPRQVSSTASSAELARREPTRTWTLALRAGERC